jgi:hypothetical protein
MNRLSRAERAQIIRALVEGNSIRSTARMTGAARNTITSLLVQLGTACAAYQDRTLRYLTSTRIECDEIWAFCYAKAKNVPEDHRGEFGYGDVWTWTAIDPETKLVPSWLVGMRDMDDARVFIADLRSRLMAPRVQITTDGHVPYVAAIEAEFGQDVDDAMLIKTYGIDDNMAASPTARRYSPNKVRANKSASCLATPIPRSSRPRLSSARTSRCGWGCGDLRA